jgi:hypothetical protein
MTDSISDAKLETVKTLLETITENGAFTSLVYRDKDGMVTERTVRIGVKCHLVECATVEEGEEAKRVAAEFKANNPYILRAWDTTADRKGREKAIEDGKEWDGSKAYRSFKMDSILKLTGKGVDMVFHKYDPTKVTDLFVLNNGREMYIVNKGMDHGGANNIAIKAGKAKLSTRSCKTFQGWVKAEGIKLFTMDSEKTPEYIKLDEEEKAVKLAGTKCSYCKTVCGADHVKNDRKVACLSCFKEADANDEAWAKVHV